MSENEPFEITSGRTFPFSQPGDWVALAPISPGAKATYVILCGHVRFTGSPADAECWPTLTTIGELIPRPNGKPTTSETVSSWVKELETLGAINVRETRSNHGRRKHFMVHQMPPDGYEGHRSYSEFYAARRKATSLDLEKNGGPKVDKTAGQPDLEKNGGPDLEKNGGPDLEKNGGKEHQGDKDQTKEDQHTHTPSRATHSSDGIGDKRVCVSDGAKRVFVDALTTAMPPEARGRISQRQKTELSELVDACLARGHSATTIAYRTNGICNAQTLYPAKFMRDALSELESESPAASRTSGTPGAPNVSSVDSACIACGTRVSASAVSGIVMCQKCAAAGYADFYATEVAS